MYGQRGGMLSHLRHLSKTNEPKCIMIADKNRDSKKKSVTSERAFVVSEVDAPVLPMMRSRIRSAYF